MVLMWLAVCSAIPAKAACKDNAKLCTLVRCSADALLYFASE